MKHLRILATILAFTLVVAACGDDDSSLIDQADPSNSDGAVSLDDLPTDVGDLPGVSGECEALLNLFLSIGGVFLGGELSTPNAATLANLPPAVSADALFVAETLAEFSAGLQALGIDLSDPQSMAAMSEAQQQAFAELGDSLDSDRFNTATDNLSAYGEQECQSQFAGFDG